MQLAPENSNYFYEAYPNSRKKCLLINYNTPSVPTTKLKFKKSNIDWTWGACLYASTQEAEASKS